MIAAAAIVVDDDDYDTQIEGDEISSVGNISAVDVNFVSDAEVHCLLPSATSAQVEVLHSLLPFVSLFHRQPIRAVSFLCIFQRIINYVNVS